MVTVYTKEELAKAIENRTPEILCKGEVAKYFKKKKNRKKWMKLAAGALIVGGIAALPFTGGASAAGIAAGTGIAAGAMGLTVGTVVISTAELAILCGTILGLAGILTGAEVTFNKDGSVTIKPKYKLMV